MGTRHFFQTELKKVSDVWFTGELQLLNSNSDTLLSSFSWWISGRLFPRCWVWMPQLHPFQIMKSSNYWRCFSTLIITITTFTMLLHPGTVLLTRGLISTKSRSFRPAWIFPPPGLLIQAMQPKFTTPKPIHYTKLHFNVNTLCQKVFEIDLIQYKMLSETYFSICVFKKSSF